MAAQFAITRYEHVCDYITKDGTVCGLPCLHTQCGKHLTKRPWTVCLGECGKRTQGMYGYCTPCGEKERGRLRKEKRKLEKIERQPSAATLIQMKANTPPPVKSQAELLADLLKQQAEIAAKLEEMMKPKE